MQPAATRKNAVKVIGDYEEAVAGEAKRASADGVICGHIHHADIHDRFGIRYVNTGDWMESCTAVVEHPDGRMEVIRWAAAAATRSNVTGAITPAPTSGGPSHTASVTGPGWLPTKPPANQTVRSSSATPACVTATGMLASALQESFAGS